MRITLIHIALTGLAAIFLGLFPTIAYAEHKDTKPRHVFVLDRLDLPKDAPEQLAKLIKAQFRKSVEEHPILLHQLPKEAPVVNTNDKGLYGNKPFRKFMKKRQLSAFHVVLQVTHFELSTAPNANKPGNVIDCSVQLRLFGETIPDRVMAFTGEGSSRVMLEVGKTRQRDKDFAIHDALELSLADAVNVSLKKLKPKRAKKHKKAR